MSSVTASRGRCKPDTSAQPNNPPEQQTELKLNVAWLMPAKTDSVSAFISLKIGETQECGVNARELVRARKRDRVLHGKLGGTADQQLFVLKLNSVLGIAAKKFERCVFLCVRSWVSRRVC